jgi:hypothetical protein
MARPSPHFPTITAATVGTSARGATVLILTLAGIGKIEVTLHQLLRPKRFAKAVLDQTGITLHPPQPSTWRLWLTQCVLKARRVSSEANDVR